MAILEKVEKLSVHYFAMVDSRLISIAIVLATAGNSFCPYVIVHAWCRIGQRFSGK